MSDLFTQNGGSKSLGDLLAVEGVALPLKTCPKYPETIVDAEDKVVCTIDPWRDEYEDIHAHEIARLIVRAVNVAGGV